MDAASAVAMEGPDSSCARTAPHPEGRNQSHAARDGRLCGAVEHISGLASFRGGEQFVNRTTRHVTVSSDSRGRLSVDGRHNAPTGAKWTSCAASVGRNDCGKSAYLAGYLVAASV